MYRLSREQVEAISVALMYGQRDIASKKNEQSLRYEKLCRHAATQAIIWEIACGWRSPYPPYTLWDSTLYDAITPSLYCASSVWGTTFYLDGMDDAYLVIANQMAQHYTIPSFMKDSRSAAPSYTLTPDGTGKYSITLTDTNNILSQYSFSNTSELTFSVSGNKLTVTANTPVSNVIVAPTKQVPNLDSQVFFVWEHGTQQKLMSCKTEPVYSEMPAYFSVNVPPQTGNLSLTKTTEDGKNLSGWQFGIYSNSACTTLVSGPHTTDANGKITVSDLAAGTYYVKEIGHTDSSINALYYCSSTNPQKVTVTAGNTATVSFTNKLNTGGVKLVKETNTGANLSGWKIGLYTDSTCTSAVSGSPFTTGADGTVTVTGLTPGTYYAKELPTDDTYWEIDTAVKSMTVVVNQTASVTFTNTHYGRIEFRKTTNAGNQLEGWTFRVRDSNGNVIGDYKQQFADLPPRLLAGQRKDDEQAIRKKQGAGTIMEAEMTLRPMFPTERNYSYAQSQQISMQTGLIGYLRADFGSNGGGFFSTWNDFRLSLKSEDFKLEFDEVINELRKDGNLLHDRNTLARCCYRTPDSSFRIDLNEYGFRADTDHYSYVMRLNPNKGEYNLYCYCYVKQWLDRHMRQAEKGIRFITPEYKELFRIWLLYPPCQNSR